MAQGEFALMQQHLHAALALSGVLGASLGSDQDVYTMLVDAAVEQRDADTLRKYAPAAEEAATRLDHRLHMGIAHRAWGVLHTLSGDYLEAQTRLEAALETFEGYPAPWQIGRTLMELGELARLQGKAEQTRLHLSRALGLFETLKAAPYIKQARSALESLGT